MNNGRRKIVTIIENWSKSEIRDVIRFLQARLHRLQNENRSIRFPVWPIFTFFRGKISCLENLKTNGLNNKYVNITFNELF